MKIIIEGVNGSGKSTLASYLRDYFCLPVMHPGPKPKNDITAITQCHDQLAHENCILDRATCISRIAYGDDNEVVEGLSDTHIAHMKSFQRRMIKQGCIFIHTIGNGPHQLKGYYTKEHIKNITRMRDEINSRYYQIFESIPHFKYNFETDDIDALIIKIKGELQL